MLNPIVDKYFELGVQLGVKVQCLKQIEGEHSSHSRRLYETIHFWQNNSSSQCSWSALAEAIAKIGGHENLARELQARSMKQWSSYDFTAESSDDSLKTIKEPSHYSMQILSNTGFPQLTKKQKNDDSTSIPEDAGYSSKSDSISDDSSSGSEAEYFDLVPGCGCKDNPCSIYTLCAGGCPNPSGKKVHVLRKRSHATQSHSELPFEEEDDYEDFEIETKKIQKSFGRFVLDTCNSFKNKEEASTRNLALFLRSSFPVFKSRMEDLNKAEHLQQIFDIVVDQACSWFDYEILKDLINYFGDDNDKRRFETYEAAFKTYAEQRLPKGKKHIEVGSGARKGCKQLVIKIDKEWEEVSFNDLDKLRGSFASILGVRRKDLYLADVREGCIMMTLMIPEETANAVFPAKRCLGHSQMQSFREKGVISIKCGKFSWRASASVKEVGKDGVSDHRSKTVANGLPSIQFRYRVVSPPFKKVKLSARH